MFEDRDTVRNAEEIVHIIGQYDMDELKEKQIRTEEELIAERRRILQIADREERERQLRDLDENYLTQEEYDSRMASIQELSYMTDKELRENANRYRGMLKILKRHYERQAEENLKAGRSANNVMKNLDIDGLSDQEVVDVYRSMKRHSEELSNAIHRANRSQYEARRDNSSIFVTPSDNTPSEEEITEEKVNESINDLTVDIGLVNGEIEHTLSKLVLGVHSELEINDSIKGIDADFAELRKEAEAVKDLIEELELALGKENINLVRDYNSINQDIDYIKEAIVNLKNLHINKYNSRVQAVNNEIQRLKSLTDVSEEVLNQINELELVNLCDITISNYQDRNYLDTMDYQKLFELSNQIKNIDNKLNNNEEKVEENIEQDIIDEVRYVEYGTNGLEYELLSKEEITNENKKLYENEILALNNQLNALLIKIRDNQDKLSEDYVDEVNDIYEQLNKLNNLEEVLNNKVISDKSEYSKISDRVEFLSKEIEKADLMVNSVINKVTMSTKGYVNKVVAELTDKIEKIRQEVEEKHNNGLLNDNQYDNLIKKLDENAKSVEKISDNINNAKVAEEVSADIYSYFNGSIEDIENKIIDLEHKIGELDKPIKSSDRKEIDKIIALINKEIDKLEKLLKDNPNKIEEEDTEKLNRLENARTRLNVANKVYKKKCPLLVKSVKSAKEFYKKHKKICLIIAGLAAIALLHATVGPVLIPAIMHGNIMVGNLAPALNPFTASINRILGGMINASVPDFGPVVLANGVMINPSIASSSLLKGLAISGIGTAAFLGTVTLAAKQLITKDMIDSIKELVNKMKNSELKEKLKEGKEKVTGTVKKGTEKVKETVNKPVEKTKETVKKMVKKDEKKVSKRKQLNDSKYVSELYIKYIKSGMELDEFCKLEGLTEKEMDFFTKLVELYKDMELDKKSKKKGRS